MRRATGRLLLLGVALGIAGCGSAREAAPLRGDLTLEEARAFGEFPLYFAGERLGELPLAAILRRDDTADYVSFVYGDCLPVTSDQGCAPPAEIQVWPECRRHSDMYDVTVPGTPAPERTRARGVPGAFFDGGTRLELYTRDSTIVVFAGSRGEVLRFAQALRPVKASAPSGDLPPGSGSPKRGSGQC